MQGRCLAVSWLRALAGKENEKTFQNIAMVNLRQRISKLQKVFLEDNLGRVP